MLMTINRMLRKARKEESGFTLIELIVVVVILGILAAIVIPRIINNTGTAQINADKADVQILQSAVDRYAAEHSGAIPTEAQLVPNYLRAWKDAYEIDVNGTVKLDSPST